MSTPTAPSEHRGGAAQLSAPVKLVIWDLDETFWSGTLSEGPIAPIPVNHDLVKRWNRRGIVNAICSKNDLEAVRRQLESDGLWDEFVFPSVNWEAKGQRIAHQISSMGLRAVNVLFIDDNAMNLKEAEHFAPGIQVIDPADLHLVLDSEYLIGKDDSELTRLAQYRILEAKAADLEAMAGSNEDFLRSSNIRVAIDYNAAAQTERLLELVNRSNQLNYTKTRFTDAEFAALLADPSITSGFVTVRDNYGDHGICGFFAHSATQMINFSFSCRILNMGVERWVYRELGALPLEVVGEVATRLDNLAAIDWIDPDDGTTIPSAAPPSAAADQTTRVLLKGGCDLSVVAEHLGGHVETEFSFPSPTGALVHQEHTEILRRATPETIELYGDVIDRLPFLDRAAYRSEIRSSPQSYNAIVYSALMDYTQGLYRYRDTDFVVPFGEFPVDVTSPINHARIVERLGKVGLDQEFLDWFSENFTFEGALSSTQIEDNIRWLRREIPEAIRLILINGAEVVSPSAIELTRHEHHVECNRALEQAVADAPNTSILDVRRVITSSTDLTDNLRHYSRRVYFQLATDLAALLAVPGLKRRSRSSIIGKSFALKARRFAWRAAKRLMPWRYR